jgi:hypothetical protein
MSMTREHLIEDIRNVIAMVDDVEQGRAEAERVRRAFQGLYQHIRNESDVPEQVEHCLGESVRVLEQAGDRVDERTWGYARTCLEAALDFVQEGSSAAS